MAARANDDRPLILVVSTDMVSAMNRCAELTLAGWQTAHVESVMEALSVVHTRDVHLVLLQLPMEDASGADLPSILREVDPFCYMPVLVESSESLESHVCNYLRNGADDVLSCDTSPDELVARAHSLLRVKELHNQLASSRAALQKALERERKLMAKLKRDNADLQTMCTTDPLTRLQNVRSFRNILEHEFKMALRYNHPISLLMLDVDHFKVVNDLYGHPCGDFVLKELAVILKRSVRESDVVARTGGEEFSIILSRADLRRCAVLAGRVRREVAAKLFLAYGRDIHVTISIGAASYPVDAEITEPQLMYYLADQALLVAKESGRDRVVALHELEADVRRRLCRQYRSMQTEQEVQTCSQTASDTLAAR